MSIALETVTNSVAALSMAGVKFYDLDEIPSSGDLQRSPAVFPNPGAFVSQLTVERDSFGPPADARKTITYILNYVFTFAPVGTERSLKSGYPLMVGYAVDILDAIVAADDMAGAIDVTPSIAGGFGVVTTPDGTQYLGCLIELRVMEFVR